MTLSTIHAILIRAGYTREAAIREGGRYDPADDPADQEEAPAPHDHDHGPDIDRWADEGNPNHDE